MREIKFRGKSNVQWVYGLLLKSDKDDKYKYLIQSDNEKCKCCGKELVKYFITDKETIGQFTGLKDKNRKEIYTGDIVKITEKKNVSKHKVIPMKPVIAEIEWSEEYLTYILITLSIKDAFENLADYLEEYDIEIIGNIYENKDLITKM